MNEGFELVNEKLDRIFTKLGGMDKMLRGNGGDGLLTRVKVIEETQASNMHFVGILTSFIMAATAIVAVVVTVIL